MRRQMIISITIVIGLIILDQLTKGIASSTMNIHKNYGVFLGFLSNSSAIFRIVTLATFSGFLLFIYSVLLYLLPKNLHFLKYSLSLILSGILGNVLDRITKSYTIDFIPIHFGNFHAAYNIADIFLFIGTFYFIFAIFRFEDKIWHPENSRNTYLVNPREQLRLAFKFFLISFFTSIFLGIFCISFIQSFSTLSSTQLNEFVIIYTVLAFLFSASTFLIGVIISHKSAGPLYAFELYVERLLSGSTDRLSLRDGDNYKHLENVANKLHDYFHNK